MAPFEHQLRVRYVECDMQGVVFNAHYLTWFDINIAELWRAALGSYDAMLERGVDVVVAEASVRFRAPARFDEVLTLSVGVAHLGTTSAVTDHRVLRDGELLAEGTVRHVVVEREGLTKAPIPDWLRSALQTFGV